MRHTDESIARLIAPTLGVQTFVILLRSLGLCPFKAKLTASKYQVGCRLFAQQGRLSIDSDNSIRFKLEVSEWIDLPLSSGGFYRYSVRL